MTRSVFSLSEKRTRSTIFPIVISTGHAFLLPECERCVLSEVRTIGMMVALGAVDSLYSSFKCIWMCSYCSAANLDGVYLKPPPPIPVPDICIDSPTGFVIQSLWNPLHVLCQFWIPHHVFQHCHSVLEVKLSSCRHP